MLDPPVALPHDRGNRRRVAADTALAAIRQWRERLSWPVPTTSFPG
jgi:hypothetical protein